MRDKKKIMTMPGSKVKVKVRSKVGNSTVLDHFQNLSPPPFIIGLAYDHGFLN